MSSGSLYGDVSGSAMMDPSLFMSPKSARPREYRFVCETRRIRYDMLRIFIMVSISEVQGEIVWRR